jgi:hypothetical protein
MKATFSVIAIAQHHDAESSFTCKTAPNQYGGLTTITVTLSDAYDAEITGTQSGGIAQFIREVGPYNVKISHEADSTIYTNNDGVELFLTTGPINGKLVTSASFKEGSEFPTVSMTCSSN